MSKTDRLLFLVASVCTVKVYSGFVVSFSWKRHCNIYWPPLSEPRQCLGGGQSGPRLLAEVRPGPQEALRPLH